jgi:hypothetical protein
MDEQSLPDLKQVIKEFPYFQTARLLFIKNLHILDHISLNNELKITASHIHDRKKLFFLLNNIDFIPSKENITIEEKQETKKDNPLNLLDYERSDNYYDLAILHKEEKHANKNKKMTLIDNFLKQQNIEKIKVTNVNTNENEDFSVKSSQENDELMTETLANIYIKQNLFLKAKDIFLQLSLKYPEKSIYFAARIKEIDKHINNHN